MYMCRCSFFSSRRRHTGCSLVTGVQTCALPVSTMSEEILRNITPMESRVAVVENGVLQEVHVERTQRRGIVGNIYKGKVVRVLPGMQSAFVDIGLDRETGRESGRERECKYGYV